MVDEVSPQGLVDVIMVVVDTAIMPIVITPQEVEEAREIIMNMTMIVTIIHMEQKDLAVIGQKTIPRDFEEGKIRVNIIDLKIKGKPPCSLQRAVAGGEC